MSRSLGSINFYSSPSLVTQPNADGLSNLGGKCLSPYSVSGIRLSPTSGSLWRQGGLAGWEAECKKPKKDATLQPWPSLWDPAKVSGPAAPSTLLPPALRPIYAFKDIQRGHDQISAVKFLPNSVVQIFLDAQSTTDMEKVCTLWRTTNVKQPLNS